MTFHYSRFFLPPLLACASAVAFDVSKLPPAAAVAVDFERDIQPLFADRCIKCHGPEKQKGGLRLDG